MLIQLPPHFGNSVRYQIFQTMHTFQVVVHVRISRLLFIYFLQLWPPRFALRILNWYKSIDSKDMILSLFSLCLLLHLSGVVIYHPFTQKKKKKFRLWIESLDKDLEPSSNFQNNSTQASYLERGLFDFSPFLANSFIWLLLSHFILLVNFTFNFIYNFWHNSYYITPS